MPMGLRFFMAARRVRSGRLLIAVEDDLADLDGGAFLDVEGEGDGGGRDGLDFGADGGELVAVLAEQLLEDDFGALDAGGVVLASTVMPTLSFLKRSSDVGERDGVEAVVVDGRGWWAFP